MAVKNRTEINTQVDTKIVPTVTNAIHRDFLKNDFVNSAVLRKDVIATETPTSGAVTIDFSNKDLATVTTTTNLSASFTNIENGDVKYLQVTKAAGNAISFSGASDVSIRKNYITSTVTLVIYKVSNKNNIISVESINIDNNRILETKVIEIGDWDMSTSPTIFVSHGLSEFRNVRKITALIRNDDDNAYYPLNFTNNGFPASGSVGYIDRDYIYLERVDNGIFKQNGINFDSISYNRGWITIEYANQ